MRNPSDRQTFQLNSKVVTSNVFYNSINLFNMISNYSLPVAQPLKGSAGAPTPGAKIRDSTNTIGFPF